MQDDPFGAARGGGTLAQAVVDTIREPLLVLNGDLRVIAASRAFCSTFQVSQAETHGRRLQELGSGQWDVPVLNELLTDIIPMNTTMEAFEVEHDFPDIGHRVMLLNAREVCHDANRGTELLLVIEDVTERRMAEKEKDELLRQKENLLREMRHRINNSLQIIASILLLKAQSVQSEETRRQLEDAHRRVLSVAAVQDCLQDAGPAGDEIRIGPYLTKLCDSLSKSMISERRPFALQVSAGADLITSSEAVSLGLITTELVINAQKHAFPDRNSGSIEVRFRRDRDAEGWRLSVEDDGVGKSRPAAPAVHGLGTGIVEALARQLGCVVEVETGSRGTKVSVVHRVQPA